jgi:hypothetical protein
MAVSAGFTILALSKYATVPTICQQPSTCNLNPHYVGFEVLTVVVMKCSVFWDIMPYIPLKVN